MSLADLFDHTVRVYRVDTIEDDLGDPEQGYALIGGIPTFPNARPDQAWSGTLQDRGPGEEGAGDRRWFLSPGLTVQKRDILDVTAGPEAPTRLRVLSVTRPTAPLSVHHLEVNVEPYDGDLW